MTCSEPFSIHQLSAKDIAYGRIIGCLDDPVIALYTKLGVREDVLHFDIAVDDSSQNQKI
jgi:hypothetical protein